MHFSVLPPTLGSIDSLFVLTLSSLDSGEWFDLHLVAKVAVHASEFVVLVLFLSPISVYSAASE